MAFQPVTLKIEIGTSPANRLSEIENYFDRAFNGERGTDETKPEFLLRKLEEYIKTTCQNLYVQDRLVGTAQTTKKEFDEAFGIRVQKNLPVVINELGDNDPSMSAPKIEKKKK